MVPDLYELNVERGDRLLLCSDGLYGMVTDERMQAILEEHPDPQEATDALVEEAKLEGGHDNITAVVVNILRDAPQTAKASTKKTRRYLASFLCIFLVVIALAVVGIFTYARSNAYLIAQDDKVTVYRGILNSGLSWYERTTDVTVSDLPSTTQEKLQEGIACGSLDKANETVASYQSNVKAATTSPSTGTTQPPSLSTGAAMSQQQA